MRIAYVNVFVNDLERAIDFYASKLGLEPIQTSAEHGYASFRAGPISLGLAVAGADHAELVGRLTGVGVAVDDLEKEHARLSALGVSFPMAPARQPWGGFMALVEDPDGNTLYLDQISAAHS